MSKHQRFGSNGNVCACACDCDFLLEFGNQKRGELCCLCNSGEHQEPVYKYFQVKHKHPLKEF
mgnify:FL=1